MKRILHIKTRSHDELAEAVRQADEAAGANVTCLDLSAAEVDYQKLLEAIFQADVVQSW
jgi:hypothetical protein